MIVFEIAFNVWQSVQVLLSISRSYCRVDVCDSRVEVTTPFWATNSKGKVRAIVNNKEFEQAVHQEFCGQVFFGTELDLSQLLLLRVLIGQWFRVPPILTRAITYVIYTIFICFEST